MIWKKVINLVKLHILKLPNVNITKMKDKKETQLSSISTTSGLHGTSIVALLFIVVILFIMQGQEFHFGMLMAILMFLAAIGYLIYLFIFLSEAKIVGDEIIFKKQFRPAKAYSFDKIAKIRSFYRRRSMFTVVHLENEDKKLEKYLIKNLYSLSSDDQSVESILTKLRDRSRSL